MTLRRLLAAIVVGAAALTATVAGPTDDESVAEAAPGDERVLLISDSVGLGTRGVLDDFFPASWNVNIIGKPAAFVESLLDVHFRHAQAFTPWMIGDHVVVAGGYNYPYWDPDRFDRSIDAMIDSLNAAGVEHVYWVTLREVKPQYISSSAWRQVQPYYWYFPTVNAHFRRALDRHSNLTLIDWAANADRTGLTYDAIHLNRTGSELYSSLIAQAVNQTSTRYDDREVVPIDVTDDPDATAAVVNMTAVFPRNNGFLTAYPCNVPRPLAAQVVYRRDDIVGAGAVIPVDSNGQICVYQHTGTNIVVDVSGTFSAGSGVTSDVPNRLYDSRKVGSSSKLRPGTYVVDVNDGNSSVTDPIAVAVTAVEPDGPGYVSMHPCDQEHETATVNVTTPGRNLSNTAIVDPGATAQVCVTIAVAPMHVVIDRTATFNPPSGAAMLSVGRPHRIVDTRNSDARVPAGGVVSFSIGDTDLITPQTDPTTSGVEAVAFNLAIIQPDAGGYATVWPCEDTRPLTSNINFGASEVLSNFVVGQLDDDGDVCVFVTTGTHLAIDVLAGFGAGYDASLPSRALDSRLTN